MKALIVMAVLGLGMTANAGNKCEFDSSLSCGQYLDMGCGSLFWECMSNRDNGGFDSSKACWDYIEEGRGDLFWECMSSRDNQQK